MSHFLADDFEAIRQRLEEIKSERKPPEEPKSDNIYGTFFGFTRPCDTEDGA